jgi:hypothetical protein
MLVYSVLHVGWVSGSDNSAPHRKVLIAPLISILFYIAATHDHGDDIWERSSQGGC